MGDGINDGDVRGADMNKQWKKLKEEWDIKSILLFGIPFLFVISFFLCAFLADAQLRSGNQKIVLFNGTQPINLYAGSTLISRHNNPPAITAFSASPSTIDLDTRASGTITFTLGVTGSPGATTNAQIVQLPNGANIGTTFTAGAGANISTTLPNILQPQQTTTYRLFATNSGGSSHRDTTVTVTKNPTLTNCRRIGSITRPGFTNYTFGFTLTGLPRPTVTYVFSGGQTGTVSTSHYQQGSNPYTWTASNWVVTMPNANAQSLVLTARNSSGTATCTLSNINN